MPDTLRKATTNERVFVGRVKSKLIRYGHPLLSSASSLEDDAFRAVSANYEDRDLNRGLDRRFSVTCCGGVGRGKRSHTTIVVLGQSSNNTRARQERAWQGKEGLMFNVSTSIHTIVSGRSGADS